MYRCPGQATGRKRATGEARPLGLDIRRYRPGDRAAATRLWEECGLMVPWNDAGVDADKKYGFQPELFLVGLADGELAATVMAGYDGHRGWLNYLAVAERHRGSGFGRKMVERAESELKKLGCLKINIQIRPGNEGVVEFYRALGYDTEELVDMGKFIDI